MLQPNLSVFSTKDCFGTSLINGGQITSQPRLNEAITAATVFLISSDGETYGVVDHDQALWFALDQELDLVEIGPNANPPVCKVIDYKKYRYEKEKQARKQKAQHRAGGMKEIKLGYKTDGHDIETKARRAQEFLEKGNRVRVFMVLRGREQAFGNQATSKIEEFKSRVGAEFDLKPNRQGNRISAILKR